MRLLRAALQKSPLFVRKTIQDARANWRGRRPSFAGVYQSFDELGTTAFSAEPDQVAEAVAGVAEARRDLVSGALIAPRRGRALMPAVAATLALTTPGNRLRILDFGGAAGVDFAHLLCTMGRDAKVSYTVVDLPAVNAAGRKVWSDDDRIEFSDALPERTFDLVYSWSSIHYVRDPHALLASFVAMKPKAILIVGTPVADKAFVRAQRNQSVPYPQWVISLPAAEAHMLSLGYRLASRQAVDEGYNVDNYAPEYQVRDTAALLFVPTGDTHP